MTSSPTGPERAIQSSSEDKLERSRFIERLASALVNPATKKSTGVVVGIAGPWGSGKSSILNLLQEHLREKYEDALIVRFDPWLVSGRNDLIAEFLGELIGTIKADEKRAEKFKKLGSTIAQYGAQLSPVGNLLIPGIGSVASGGFKAMEKALSKKESLGALRAKLVKELVQSSAPIVVLIDEIDRVEDEEIRTVAQLVRSVADFRGISYVLAYDPERVVQALGTGAPTEERDARGRGYLEKIVQLQIPLPITFADEIGRLLNADLRELSSELRLPENFENISRYQELAELLAHHAIHTLRDTRRLVGTFHVLAGMLHGEVDWIDLLAYSALLVKSPATVAKMRRDPEDFLARRSLRNPSLAAMSAEEWFDNIVPASERNEATKELLTFLFPRTFEDYAASTQHTDAFSHRRPLLTALRLGLLPGAFSRGEIQTLVRSPPEQIQASLHKAYENGRLSQLTDRLDELYVEIGSFDHVRFWQGVAGFAKKPDCKWMTSYQPMHEALRGLAAVLEQAVRRNPGLREQATTVFTNLRGSGDSELAAYWLRTHFFVYGLFGREQRGGEAWFLSAKQTEALAQEMAHDWRLEHLSGKLIPCRWDLQTVYTMVDTEVWDDPCRKALEEGLADDRGLDGFTLMLFGGPFSTEQSTVGKICNYESYLERVRLRLNSNKTNKIHESVRVAFRKALGEV